MIMIIIIIYNQELASLLITMRLLELIMFPFGHHHHLLLLLLGQICCWFHGKLEEIATLFHWTLTPSPHPSHPTHTPWKKKKMIMLANGETSEHGEKMCKIFGAG